MNGKQLLGLALLASVAALNAPDVPRSEWLDKPTGQPASPRRAHAQAKARKQREKRKRQKHNR